MRGFRRGEVRSAYKGRYKSDVLRTSNLLLAEEYLNRYVRKTLKRKFGLEVEFRL